MLKGPFCAACTDTAFTQVADSVPFLDLWHLQNGAVLCNTAFRGEGEGLRGRKGPSARSSPPAPRKTATPPPPPTDGAAGRHNARIVIAPARQGALYSRQWAGPRGGRVYAAGPAPSAGGCEAERGVGAMVKIAFSSPFAQKGEPKKEASEALVADKVLWGAGKRRGPRGEGEEAVREEVEAEAAAIFSRRRAEGRSGRPAPLHRGCAARKAPAVTARLARRQGWALRALSGPGGLGGTLRVVLRRLLRTRGRAACAGRELPWKALQCPAGQTQPCS